MGGKSRSRSRSRSSRRRRKKKQDRREREKQHGRPSGGATIREIEQSGLGTGAEKNTRI